MISTSLQSLIDERDHLLASLADLDRERAAGDVDEESYAQLRARYTARAAQALRAIEASEQPKARITASRFERLRRALGRQRARQTLLSALVVCFVALGITLAITLSGQRLPGEQESGSVSVPASAQVRNDLAEASLVGSEGQLSQAISLYDAVLAKVPNQPVALTYKGWLERLAGLAGNSKTAVIAGDALLQRAARVAPRYSDARGLYGLSLYEDGDDASGAVVQFPAFLADDPSQMLLGALKDKILAAYRQLDLKPPPALS